MTTQTSEPAYGYPEVSAVPARHRVGPGLLIDLVLFAAVVVVAVFGLVRPFVVEPFYVSTQSMAPTLDAGDQVVTAKFAYRIGSPDWGDIAVLRNPDDPGQLLVKRVVGLPGQTVEVRHGVLLVDGQPRREPYVAPRHADPAVVEQTTVPAGSVYVLGDNRASSVDSRSFGPVPQRNLVGKVVLHLG